jgi:hypothetical protein
VHFACQVQLQEGGSKKECALCEFCVMHAKCSCGWKGSKKLCIYVASMQVCLRGQLCLLLRGLGH